MYHAWKLDIQEDIDETDWNLLKSAQTHDKYKWQIQMVKWLQYKWLMRLLVESVARHRPLWELKGITRHGGQPQSHLEPFLIDSKTCSVTWPQEGARIHQSNMRV